LLQHWLTLLPTRLNWILGWMDVCSREWCEEESDSDAEPRPPNTAWTGVYGVEWREEPGWTCAPDSSPTCKPNVNLKRDRLCRAQALEIERLRAQLDKLQRAFNALLEQLGAICDDESC
jgi:hypothetical protein